MRIHDLRDWRSCLISIRRQLDYSGFKASFGETQGGDEEDIAESAIAFSEETDQAIAEGMLHTVVSLPPQEARPQLQQFADELAGLQPDPAAATETGDTADTYREFFHQFALLLPGLPAVVEAFSIYAEGRYDTRQDPLSLLEEAQEELEAEPEVARRLVGEAGSLQLRGLGEMDELLLEEGLRAPKEPLADWIEAIAAVMHRLSENLDEYPLGEAELAREQWQAPDDKERIEYKKAKLARLGIVDAEVQDLLLPLFAPRDHRLSGTEKEAIMAAGPKVAPGLIAIAGDEDSQLQCSVSEGEAAIRAVVLLGDMRVAEAVPTLFEILKNTEYLAIIHDRAIHVLHDEMPDLAFDAALEEFDDTSDVELKSEMAGILAKGGRGKPGVFERLITFFRGEKDEQTILAGYLADLGDPRALPDLRDALRTTDGPFGLADIEEAIVELGGELTWAERQKSQRRREKLLGGLRDTDPADLFPPAPLIKPTPLRVTKIGRNDPCPCGSGKKYKKCCGR